MEYCDICDPNTKNKCILCTGNSYKNINDKCTKCSSSFMSPTYMGECLDTCGDGRRFSNSLCDDGNL